MSLKRTVRYSIFLILFITRVSSLNLNLAYSRQGRLPNSSCTVNLHPVTTRNCRHFYYKTSFTEVLKFNNFWHNVSFYGETAEITWIKIDQNYSKYIFSKSVSHNLQPIRSNENNVKHYWILFLLFLHK